MLDLGDVKNFAVVTVNGRTFPPLWRPPFRVDITDAVRPGDTELDLVIEITNLWPNRLIGDDFLEEDCNWRPGNGGDHRDGLWSIPDWVKRGKPSPTGRHTFTTWRHWTRDDAPLPSGLLGPVRLIIAAPPENDSHAHWHQQGGTSDGCSIVNWAQCGRSTKTFIAEGWWDKVLASACPGDFVLIQFGHNDQKVDKPVGVPVPEFKENLARMVADVRAKGATPVFATPIVRLWYKNGLVQDFGLDAWAEAMRESAAELGVDLVDMRNVTRAAANEAGEEEALTWNAPEDRTHPAPKGARHYAGLFLAEIRRLKLPLAELFVAPSPPEA